MQTTINRTMGVADWAMLLALAVIWGASFFCMSVALREIPPLTLVALRVGLAALILAFAMAVTGMHVPREKRVWIAFLTMGLLNNAIPFSLIAWGQTHIASGLAAILNATTPLATVIVAHVLTQDERMTRRKLFGVLIGLSGVAVMIGPAVLAGLGSDLWAQLAVLAATISYAFAGVYGQRFKRLGVTPMTTAAGQVTASSLLLVPVVLAVDHPWMLPMPGLATLGAVLAIAAPATALAFIIYFRILASAGATNLLLVTFLVPVSAILLGVLMLGERLDTRHLFGMAMIGLGLAAIDGRLVTLLLRSRQGVPVAPEVCQGQDI